MNIHLNTEFFFSKVENPLVGVGRWGWSRYNLHRLTIIPPVKFGWDWISNNQMYHSHPDRHQIVYFSMKILPLFILMLQGSIPSLPLLTPIISMTSVRPHSPTPFLILCQSLWVSLMSTCILITWKSVCLSVSLSRLCEYKSEATVTNLWSGSALDFHSVNMIFLN